MSLATHASLVLARFEDRRPVREVNPPNQPETLFLDAAADFRAANSNVRELEAFKFAIYGLHTGEAAAQSAIANRMEITPWIADAIETWSAVMVPFRHFGEANFVDPKNPGPQFETVVSPPDDTSPIVIMTSVGWVNTDSEAMDRIQRFGAGVGAVRTSMTGVHGLHSQQSFSFPGFFVWDGITVTFWKNLAAAMAFAYGPGVHRDQVKHQREIGDGDRTSFTRYRVLWSDGTWHGTNPIQVE